MHQAAIRQWRELFIIPQSRHAIIFRKIYKNVTQFHKFELIAIISHEAHAKMAEKVGIGLTLQAQGGDGRPFLPDEGSGATH